MEGAGDESLSGHTAVPETADGDLGLAADVAGLLFHGVFLSSGIGCKLADAVVGFAGVRHLAHLPYPRQVDSCVAGTSCCRCNHECRFRLLGLLSETAWSFLCSCDRHDFSCCRRVDIQTTARKILSASHLYLHRYRCALSVEAFMA